MMFPQKNSAPVFFLLKSRKNESNAHVEGVRILPPEGTCTRLWSTSAENFKLFFLVRNGVSTSTYTAEASLKPLSKSK